MEWVAGIDFMNGKLVAVIAAGANIRHENIEALANFEPKAGRNNKRKSILVDFSFKDLERNFILDTSARFDMPMTNRHAVFQGISISGHRFHLPALVLLRTLVQPHTYLVPRLFLPNFINEISRPVELDGNLYWKLVPPVGERTFSLRFVKLLAEFLIRDDAIKSYSSVHVEAMKGNIDFQLPDARFTGLIYGYFFSGEFWCTSITHTNIRHMEKRSPHLPGNLLLFAPSESTLFERKILLDYSIPLSDAEWSLIAPLFSLRKSSFDSDVRHFINCIFFKTYTGKAWRQLDTSPYVWYTVAQRLRSWKLTGVWYEACEKLAETRASKLR
jgi:hypothetical protein